MDWELVDSGTYSSTYKNVKTQEYLYMNEQVNGSVIVRYGVWETREVKNIPVKGIQQNYLPKKKSFKGWKEALEFKEKYIAKN